MHQQLRELQLAGDIYASVEAMPPDAYVWLLQVQSTKTVKEQCLKGRLMDTVEGHDQAGCFSACGVRNVTDTCWIGCFFDTLLGQDSAKSVTRPLAGMSVQAIERGWTTAFLPVAQGGCAAI